MANLVTVVVAALTFMSANASPISNKSDVPVGLIFMGATQNKELYITDASIIADFTESLVIGCPMRFNMELAAVESTEEVAIIDKYFDESLGEATDHAWTSAVSRIGRIPSHWASTGFQITEFPAEVKGPWSSGGSASPAYRKHNCVIIERTCAPPPGSPNPGCWPYNTHFMYTLCDEVRRYICQKEIV